MKLNAKNPIPGHSDLPEPAKPALKALAAAESYSLVQLTEYSEKELSALHGIGKNAIESIKTALKENKLSLRQ